MEQTIQNIPLENSPKEGKRFLDGKGLFVLLIIIALGAGIITGYQLASKKGGLFGIEGTIPKGEIVKGKEFGAKDASTFKDTAQGVIEKGGLDGEGTHKLLREGGPSQTVYLTSSVLDLDQFDQVKVQIWGETFKAQKAGWLMDVGKVKILE